MEPRATFSAVAGALPGWIEAASKGGTDELGDGESSVEEVAVSPAAAAMEAVRAAVAYVDAVFPNARFSVKGDAVMISAEDRTGPGSGLWPLLMLHIECLATSEIDEATGTRTGHLVGAALAAVRKKSVEQAYRLIKDRLYYRQYRSAVVLLSHPGNLA